jgi:hypothetical protein
MSDINYIGISGSSALGGQPRYFYALRRTDDGELYFSVVDTVDPSDSVTINAPGDGDDDYTEFEVGTDFFEGRDITHNLIYPNLNYEQYRWDNKVVYYYLDSQGNLVARIGQEYAYPASKDA